MDLGQLLLQHYRSTKHRLSSQEKGVIMNIEEIYNGIPFDRSPRTVPRRLILIGIILVIFTLLYAFIPDGILYWLLLLPLVILIWMASHGWRQALAALHEFIHGLEQRYPLEQR
jgi:hypothetical protein